MAFSQAPADTMPKQKTLGVVVIYDNPVPFAAASRYTSLNDALGRNKSSTLTDLLQENTGIYLKNYGPGMLSTIAFRGTGAEHTALVWNSITINYPVLGLADFAVIPANGFSSVGLLHGSSSTLFGSSAIGGSILLRSKQGFSDNKRIQTQASFETGSYNRWFGNVNSYYSSKTFFSNTSLQWFSADNDYRFVNEFKLKKPIERQINSAIKQYSLMQDLGFKTGEYSKIVAHAWYNYTDRQIPPTLTSSNTAAMQQDRSLRLLAQWDRQAYNNRFYVNAAYVNDYINYADNYITSPSRMSTSTLQGVYNYTSNSQALDVKAGVEGQYFTADIKEYNGFKAEWRASVYANVSYAPDLRKWLLLSAGYRQIFVQGHITSAAPTFGLRWRIRPTIIFKVSASRSFRIPTLNERYYIPGGNPSLKPEGGWNYEAGVLYDRGFNNNFNFMAEVTGFAMQVNNWLQWQPTNFGYWEPKNLKQVLSRGAEASITVGYTGKKFEAKLNTAYALAIATNQKIYDGQQGIAGKDLIYTPRNVASAGLTLTWYGYSLFTNLQYTGMRYTTTDNAQTVDGYVLLNARASKDIKLKNFTLSIWLQALNLTNNSYFNLPYRPMPLRNYRVGLTVTFDKQLKNKSSNDK